jgi:hypothetical protein
LENLPIDLLLCTRSFAKSHSIELRNPHARFNFFPESKGLYIKGCSRSPSAQLTVNGDATMGKPYHLNQNSIKILLDKLGYQFQWTKFAAEDNFKEERRRYVSRALDGSATANVDVEMPLLKLRRFCIAVRRLSPKNLLISPFVQPVDRNH